MNSAWAKTAIRFAFWKTEFEAWKLCKVFKKLVVAVVLAFFNIQEYHISMLVGKKTWKIWKDKLSSASEWDSEHYVRLTVIAVPWRKGATGEGAQRTASQVALHGEKYFHFHWLLFLHCHFYLRFHWRWILFFFHFLSTPFRKGGL